MCIEAGFSQYFINIIKYLQHSSLASAQHFMFSLLWSTFGLSPLGRKAGSYGTRFKCSFRICSNHL